VVSVTKAGLRPANRRNRWRGWALTFILSALAAGAASLGDAAAMRADFKAPGPRPSMAGFLVGIVPSDPPPLTWAQSLAPAMWRGGVGPIDYARSAGATYDLVTNFMWGVPRANWQPTGNPPYGNDPQKPDWSRYEQFLTSLARQNRDRVTFWEFWNEPDFENSWPQTAAGGERCPDSWGPDPSQDLLFETYAHFYHVMRRELGADALLVAPSTASYCLSYLRKFLDFSIARGLEVNVLSWHELGGPSERNLSLIEDHLAQARAEFFFDPARPHTARYRPLKLKQIHINEMVGRVHYFRPGETAAYLYFLERGGADAAGHACWEDNGAGDARATGCQNNTLDSLLVPLSPDAPPSSPRQPRAVWWVYKAYADIRARRVPCEPNSPQTVCLAGLNDTGQPVLIVGSFAPDRKAAATLELDVQNLAGQPTFAAVRRVHARIERLEPGPQAVPAPSVVREMDLSVIAGHVPVALPPLASHEAYIVTITPNK